AARQNSSLTEDRRRVDASADRHGDWVGAAKAALHRSFEQLAECLDVLGERSVSHASAGVERPVLAEDSAVARNDRHRGGRNAEEAAEAGKADNGPVDGHQLRDGVLVRRGEDAIAQLMLEDWSDVHRTCFHGIFSVPPGAMAIVT